MALFTHWQSQLFGFLSISTLILLSVQPASSLAGDLQIRFDAPSLIPVYISSDEATSTRGVASDRQLIEFHVDISTWLVSGKPHHLREILIEVVDLSGNSRVIDFLPHDETSSDFIGGIKHEKSTEKNQSLGLNGTSNFHWIASGNGHVAAGNKKTEKISFEKKPLQQQVVVSGTSRQGRGVTYRFRKAVDTSLEGKQELTLHLSVPRDWSKSLIRIDCIAMGSIGGAVPGTRQIAIVGQERFFVPIFSHNDSASLACSERFFTVSNRLKHLASEQEEAIYDQDKSSPLQRLAILLSIEEPAVPKTWLKKIVEQGDAKFFDSVAPHLPADVRQASEDYLLARLTLLSDE